MDGSFSVHRVSLTTSRTWFSLSTMEEERWTISRWPVALE